MTVGFHSPLPPVRSGVADYSATLLRALRKRGQVEAGSEKADVHLYHLGNNQLHRAIYEQALARPGVVVLHDAVLQHFFLGAYERNQYVEECVYNYGEWERVIAETMWRERASSGMDLRYFERPMLRRVAEQSLAVIVHNPAAGDAVRRHAPAANIVEIPHFFEAPAAPSVEHSRDVRAHWGIPSDDFVFAVFGYLRESKRVIPILRAFEKLHALMPETVLLLAGDFVSPDLERAAAFWLSRPGIRRAPYLDEKQFWDLAYSVDCCLNLRYPAAGETSGIGVRLMGIGKPVLFTEGREIGPLPQSACIRVSPGLEEKAELFDYMEVAARMPGIARAIGDRAAQHVREFHALDRVADQYWKTLCAACA